MAKRSKNRICTKVVDCDAVGCVHRDRHEETALCDIPCHFPGGADSSVCRFVWRKKKEQFHLWWLLRMQMCEGEREHYTYVPLTAKSKKALDSQVGEICRTQYGNLTDENMGDYEFDDGAVMVYADEVRKVDTLEEYRTLGKYLG